jgi:two-component system OmpR family response regulator
MLSMRLLLVEDDAALAGIVARGLTEEGHQVEHVPDGELGLARLRTGGFDACILDVMLPGLDGFAVVERARQSGVRTPVLILTARDAVPDRVAGLRRGADDYLTKPFAFAELLARLEALTRRGPAASARLTAGDLELDCKAHCATAGGRTLTLSHKQFALLEFFLRRRGEVVTRAMVLEQVFGYSFDPGTNIVDVHVANLRQKIDSPGSPSHITTVRGVGYRFEDT